ncbi:hypothetical protein JCM10207_008253 [Rhodosporidiobolus poonsookiae]
MPSLSSLPRLTTVSTSASSPSAASPLTSPEGATPLLAHYTAHRRASLPPRSPSPVLSPASASAATAFLFAAPPKATRLGLSTKRWAVLVVLVVVGGLALTRTTAGGDLVGDAYAASVRERWRTSVQGVKAWAWAGAAGSAGGEEGAEEAGLREAEGEKTAPAGMDDAPKALDSAGDRIEDVSDETGRLGYADAAGAAVEVQEPVEASADEEDDLFAAPPSTFSDPEYVESFRLNVRPVPRPPPRDAKVASEMRYLSFNQHSGFHNQRKSIVNALTLAALLNRTLLLPPARLGDALAWSTDKDLNQRIVTSERKHLDGTCRGPDNCRFSYVGWEWIVSPRLLEGRTVVDRWNSSEDLFFLPPEEGGLGLSPDDVWEFKDPVRRSYQIYDDPSAPTEPPGYFASRIELDDLRNSDKRLLKFNSLFSGGRLMLSREENRQIMIDAGENMILQSEGLDAISNRVRDLLGSYVAAHARVGDGIFKTQAKPNMQQLFRRLTRDVLGLRKRVVDELLADPALEPPTAPAGGAGGGKNPKLRARAFGSAPEGAVEVEEREGEMAPEDDPRDAFPAWFPSSVFAPRSLPLSAPAPSLARRALPPSSSSDQAHRRGPSQPLAPTLHCRAPLHTRKDLLPLNTPLYIATDSRAPTADPALRPFFRWFPCVFLLGDFAERVEGVNDEPVSELVELVEAQEGVEGRWVSEWDGQAMDKFVFPFLEAEIAARGVEVVGTRDSTFSGYTSGMLHEMYVQQGMVAGWNND